MNEQEIIEIIGRIVEEDKTDVQREPNTFTTRELKKVAGWGGVRCGRVLREHLEAGNLKSISMNSLDIHGRPIVVMGWQWID